MRLLLHIGPPKTGSTAIQAGLEQNREALERAGILLFAHPAEDMPLRALGTLYCAENLLEKWPYRPKFETPRAARAWSAAAWAALAAQVRASRADLCVISSEHLGYGVDAAALVAAFGRLFSDITVLAYLRDPADLYFSLVQQNLRGGKPLALLRTPANFHYPQRQAVAQYADAVGPENLIVRNFVRDNLCKGDVVADFFARLAPFGKTVRVDPIRANDALPGAALALLMLVNETHPPDTRPQSRERLIRRLRKSPAVAGLPAFRPDLPQARALIRARMAADCDWLNRMFLKGQIPLETAAEAAVAEAAAGLTDAEWRAQLRAALLACLTPATLRAVAAAAVPAGR